MRERNLAHKLGAVTPPCAGCHMEDICENRGWTCARFRIWATDPNAKGARGTKVVRGYHVLTWEESWKDEPPNVIPITVREDGIAVARIPTTPLPWHVGSCDPELSLDLDGLFEELKIEILPPRVEIQNPNWMATVEVTDDEPVQFIALAPEDDCGQDWDDEVECGNCGYFWDDEDQLRCPSCGGGR